MLAIEISLPTFYLQELYDFLTSVLEFQLEEQEEAEILLRLESIYIRLIKIQSPQTVLVDLNSHKSSLSFLLENDEQFDEVLRKLEFFHYRTEEKFTFFTKVNDGHNEVLKLQDIEGRVWLIKVREFIEESAVVEDQYFT